MSANRPLAVLVSVLLVLLLPAGCGKKGQLYLPDQPRPAPAEGKAVPAPAPEDDGPSLPSAPAAP